MYSVMQGNIDNWKMQVRRGYLELCILGLIQKHGRLYGFDLLDKLSDMGLSLKEGTLYPMLNRMAEDKNLQAEWETEAAKGHPRKFYSLTAQGNRLLDEMKTEFEKMVEVLKGIQKPTRGGK